MNKYKIGKYIVKADSIRDAVSIVRQIKDAYDNGIILEKHETYKGPNGQFTVVKVRRDNGRIQYVVTSDKRDIDAGDKMPSGTIENDLASAIKTAKEYANARKRNSDAAHDSMKDSRRINYDDDIIEVTLNGKVVFRGYAEDWLDNNFDSNFKWTGSQYEASNAKGKWVVRVIDSFQKDSLTVRDVIQSLINEETSAISSYNVALETLKDHIPAEAYEAIKAIRDDEQRHVENLYAVLNGNVTAKNLEN